VIDMLTAAGCDQLADRALDVLDDRRLDAST